MTSRSIRSCSPRSPLAVTLSELESHLWGAANILRGSPVDRTDWKSYILPLLFFKRLCDVYDDGYAEIVAAYGQDVEQDGRVFWEEMDAHLELLDTLISEEKPSGNS